MNRIITHRDKKTSPESTTECTSTKQTDTHLALFLIPSEVCCGKLYWHWAAGNCTGTSESVTKCPRRRAEGAPTPNSKVLVMQTALMTGSDQFHEDMKAESSGNNSQNQYPSFVSKRLLLFCMPKCCQLSRLFSLPRNLLPKKTKVGI